MAKRGRPPKNKAKVEDALEEQVDETTETIAKEKEVQDFVGEGIEKSR